MYQIYFYVNLFSPLEISTIIYEKNLNKQTIEKLLNEILSANRQENLWKKAICNKSKKRNLGDLSWNHNLFLQEIVGLVLFYSC